jgi:hypothetical protein
MLSEFLFNEFFGFAQRSSPDIYALQNVEIDFSVRAHQCLCVGVCFANQFQLQFVARPQSKQVRWRTEPLRVDAIGQPDGGRNTWNDLRLWRSGKGSRGSGRLGFQQRGRWLSRLLRYRLRRYFGGSRRPVGCCEIGGQTVAGVSAVIAAAAAGANDKERDK